MTTEKKLTPQIAAMYLGCMVQWYKSYDQIGEMLSIADDGYCNISFEAKVEYLHFNDFKPILRRLSSMTEEEAAHVLQQTYFPHVTYPMRDYHLELNDYGNPRIRIDNDWFTHELTFGNKTGSIWASDGTPAHNTKISASSFAYLLSRGFDLFGLIDSGEAIEAKPGE